MRKYRREGKYIAFNNSVVWVVLAILGWNESHGIEVGGYIKL